MYIEKLLRFCFLKQLLGLERVSTQLFYLLFVSSRSYLRYNVKILPSLHFRWRMLHTSSVEQVVVPWEQPTNKEDN